MKRNGRLAVLFLSLLFSFQSQNIVLAGPSKKNPYLEESPEGRKLIIPEGLDVYLSAEYPGYRLPQESEFNPEMLKYFNSRLLGVHPAIAFGDFNGDKKQDYAILIVTGETKWGPLVELIILNGENGRDKFTAFPLGEIYNFKDDYVVFSEGKLYKGKFKKGAWYINWDKKEKTYNVAKS